MINVQYARTSAGKAPASFLAVASAPHSINSFAFPKSPRSHVKCNGVFPATIKQKVKRWGGRRTWGVEGEENHHENGPRLGRRVRKQTWGANAVRQDYSRSGASET